MKLSNYDKFSLFIALCWVVFAILDFVQDDPVWMIVLDLAVAGAIIVAMMWVNKKQSAYRDNP
jgi:hypothetical protein